ncbi:phosphoadenosine phosphosulfate reductase family protein [Eubacterium ventriosum]|uniref:phosphoadenosine phosphosulfate reductase domain-containing protein n=1 Tax=Eubacterium ventriosum TaxID=39496 RepID=UPI0039936DB5
MYAYEWDSSTGGYILTPMPLAFSKEPRPVYYKELDILGFDKYWDYDKNDSFPYMWAEANNYYYRGRLVAKTKGGSLYTPPELVLIEDPEPEGYPLRFVDIHAMVDKNRQLMEQLVQETIKKIYNTFIEYQDKVDVFYVAFSGGKDSVVALDLVQRALPHNCFKVLFGDTGMEFPDTYETVEKIKQICAEEKIEFLQAKSKLKPENTWQIFGPPAVTIRWCCSVHKTTPQIMQLREVLQKPDFTGMAFTGVRGDESLSRSEYDAISYGGKHSGQYSCHPILEWNTAELFLYIYENGLTFNNAYKKGNTRAGCLVCPMSQGKHDYMKYKNYPDDTDLFINKIITTSGKNFSKENYDRFVEQGYWRTRKSGRELSFGHDKHVFEIVKGQNVITVQKKNEYWKEWAKTIGQVTSLGDGEFSIAYEGKSYAIRTISTQEGGEQFTFPNIENSKSDIKFLSLFKSVIIKSVYCVNCGYCAAECKSGCIDMANGVHISNQCKHCFSCHDIYSHCLRYNSIKNRIGAKVMTGLDRYYSFGIKENWLRVYFDYEGTSSFWKSDGDGEVPNKKKDAFLNFVKDAGLVDEDKSLKGKEYKYIKYKPNKFAEKMFSLGVDDESMWAYLMCNLVYAEDSEEFRWFIKNIPFSETSTPESIKLRLDEVMENDKSGLGKRNICDALKSFLIKTPFGKQLGLGSVIDYEEKVSSNGRETITLNYFVRGSWKNPDEKVILYALYKFAEACGNYRQFTLTRLLDTSVESAGISPTQIFGLNRETMEKILNGLTFNYPDLIEARFTLGLDNITLKSDKTANEILNELF